MKIKDNRGSAKVVILIVAACITLGCIIFGIFKYLGNFNNKNEKGEISMEGSTTNAITETISSINVKADLGDVIIKTGDGSSVEYKYSNSALNPEIKIHNGELKIEQSGSEKMLFGFISCAGSVKNGVSGQIVVTLPIGTSLDNVRIETALGKIDVSGISAKNVNVDSDLGDINIKDCNISNKIDADIALGDIIFTDVEAAEIDVDQACGEVEAGNVTVREMKVDNSLGDIRLNGAIYNLNADDSLGDIEVTNSIDDSECKIRLDTSLGSVYYNGNKYGDEFKLN